MLRFEAMKNTILFILLNCFLFPFASATTPTMMGAGCGQLLDKIPASKDLTKFNDIAHNAFVSCLSDYLKLQTISPIGNEHLAVEFLHEAIKVLGWPQKRYDVPDLVQGQEGKLRANLIATLPANGATSYQWDQLPEKRSIILTHHADVVNVVPEQWESPDLVFSGKIAPSISQPQKQYIWGRGALDMKGIGILQLVSLVMLERSGVPREKDIHYLVLADEEEGSSGAIGTVRMMAPGQELYSLSKAVLLLNESGGSSMNLPKDGVNLHLIGVEEKGAAWMRLREDDPMVLLQNLATLRTLDIYDLIKEDKGEYQRNDCKLVEIVTPNAKVNVIASKLEVELDCNEAVSNDFFNEVFTKGFDGITVVHKTNGQKHHLTLSTSSSSHGSIGLSQSVLEVFAVGTHRLGFVKLPKKEPKKAKFYRETQTDTVKQFVKNLGKANLPVAILRRLSWMPFMRRFMLRQVANAFDIDGLFRTTCQFSALNSNENDGSVALLDCRLLHTYKDEDGVKDFFKELKKFTGNENLVIEPFVAWNVSTSPTNTPEYEIIATTLKKIDPKALVTPYLFPAGTDNKFFRDPVAAGAPQINPIPSYGFMPVFLDVDLVATMHGSNERFPLEEAGPSAIRYTQVLKELITNN